MNTKICYTCQKELPIDAFGKHSKTSDGLQIKCKFCKRAYDNKYHFERSDDRKKRKVALQKSRVQANREYIQNLREASPCTDCGQFYPSYVMDFDHIEDNKINNVATLVTTHGLEKIIEEIAKCELVCANCHRIRTHNRR